jgi:ribosomal protein S18 acetylase RimI-like enzyme
VQFWVLGANYFFMEIKRLSVDTLDDFLEYFDHRAFLENKEWSGCYCQFYLAAEDTSVTGEDQSANNRSLACSRVETGAMDGYLLYEGDSFLGWCAAASSMLFPAFPEADETLARILCFNIDPARRGEGLAGELLDLVIQDLTSRGFEALEAAPNHSGYSTKSYRGSSQMFLSRDFQKVTDLGDGFILVRKYLT